VGTFNRIVARIHNDPCTGSKGLVISYAGDSMQSLGLPFNIDAP
jgi:hypothetical protein